MKIQCIFEEAFETLNKLYEKDKFQANVFKIFTVMYREFKAL